MAKKQIIRLTEGDLHYIINESVKTLITESQESKSQSEAIKYLMQKMNWDKEKANNFVRNDLRQDITALRDKNIAKFTLGVTRMFCDRQLSDARIISNLNATLKLLSAHLNEYDRNLNGISAQELIDKFAQTRQDNVNAEKGEIDSMDFSQGSRYQIVPINSFEEAENYYEYTNPNNKWCLTYMDDMFDSYTNDGMNQIYFCLREGFENEPCEVGKNAPLDDYGLSMLSIIVNENGELVYCTTRWNHDNGGSDSSMSAKEISQVVGVNFYQVFKPNNKWQNMLSEVKEKMSRGVPYEDIFDRVDNFKNGCALIKLNRKYNIINTNGDFISNQWFDEVGSFNDGYTWILLNGKYNFINTNGDIISDQWFNNVSNFHDGGYAWVDLNHKYNFININGRFISNQWFDNGDYFKDGCARVLLDGKYNFINTNGDIISDQWFNDAGRFDNGYAWVDLNHKYNFINTNGDIISDQWFDKVDGFYNGCALVILDGKYNFINTNGGIISDQWFDNVSSFHDGYALVILDGNFNFINTNGDFISNQWFDSVYTCYNGCALVGLNNKYYKFIAKDGKLYNINENKQYNNMAKKQLIRLTEGDLHKIIKESIERIISETKLNEISADLAHRAMNAAYDKRDNGINTPEWGKRNKQAQKFRQYYSKAFKDEHNQDGNILQGNAGALTWDDKLSDGTPVSFHFAGAFEGKTKNQQILCSWEQLVSNKQLQQFFCQMSPKSAAMVAKWWKQNHIYPQNPNYGKEGFDPSFWSQYDTNAFKGRYYTFNGLG